MLAKSEQLTVWYKGQEWVFELLGPNWRPVGGPVLDAAALVHLLSRSRYADVTRNRAPVRGISALKNVYRRAREALAAQNLQ